MNFDSSIRDLQKEKLELEGKLKQVNAALAALTKLNPKAASTNTKADNNPAARPATPAAKPAPTAQPASKPATI
jgi:hypothetical protein